MSDKDPAAILDSAKAWWSTSIIDMKPGSIRFAGFPIEQLIGAVSFPQMIWLMLRGTLPTPDIGLMPARAIRGWAIPR